jgi:hypothetical protein
MQYGSHVVHTRRARGSSVGEQRRPVPSIHYGAEADGRKAASRSSVSCLFHAIFNPENLNVSCVISRISTRRSSFSVSRRTLASSSSVRRAAARESFCFGLHRYRVSSLPSPQFDPRSLPPHSGRAVESADSAQLEIPAYLWQPCLNALNARAQAYKHEAEARAQIKKSG